MANKVFINQVSSFLPNEPVANEEMEDYIGLINGNPSRVKDIVLRQNGIKYRHYALNKKQEITHTNAEIGAAAIRKLFKDEKTIGSLELLACATSIPDQILPSHASMIHGILKGNPTELYSASGVCLTSLQALKVAFLSLKAGDRKNAVCCASELVSATLLSKHYEEEFDKCEQLKVDPYMGFEKGFLRFMLSDGAGAVFLETVPGSEGISLEIDWIDITSYANELPTCMFMGAELREDGELKSWKAFESQEIMDRSVLTVKQDIRLLKNHIVKYLVDHLENCIAKHNLDCSQVKYVIPHISSMVFYQKLADEFAARNIDLKTEKWFLNLTQVGNIGSASVFVALDELFHSGKLKQGDKILLLVPESGRFSYGTALLTVH